MIGNIKGYLLYFTTWALFSPPDKVVPTLSLFQCNVKLLASSPACFFWSVDFIIVEIAIDRKEKR